MIADLLKDQPFRKVVGLLMRLEKSFQVQRQSQMARPDTDDGLGAGPQAPDPAPDFKLVDEDGKEIPVPSSGQLQEKAA